MLWISLAKVEGCQDVSKCVAWVPLSPGRLERKTGPARVFAGMVLGQGREAELPAAGVAAPGRRDSEVPARRLVPATGIATADTTATDTDSECSDLREDGVCPK